MQKFLTIPVLLVLAAFAAASLSPAPAGACSHDGLATCDGSSPCKACRSCASCKYCKKQGGKCGVCKD